MLAAVREVGVECEVAFEVEVVVAEGSEAGDVVFVDVDAGVLSDGEGAVHVHGVPQDDGVDYQAEGAELVFLSFPVGVYDFASAAVAYVAGESMAGFASVELDQDGPAVLLAVDVGQQVKGFGDAAQLGERGGEAAGAAAGEVISSSFVESAVNQVISKRMVKKQQMRWTPRGAHLLLQVRTRILNDDLADDFHRWHPGFTHAEPDREELAAAA